MTATQTETLWDVGDAATYLKVAERTVRDLCQHNQIEHIRVGKGRGVIRLRPQDVRNFVDQRLRDSRAVVSQGSSLNFD